jgi:hypothetical protein
MPDIVQRQEGTSPELNDDRFLGLGQDGTLRLGEPLVARAFVTR